MKYKLNIMKKYINLTLILVLLFYSCNSKQEIKEKPLVVEEKNINSDITTEFLISIFENIEKEDSLSSILNNNRFKEKFNNIFISEESITLNEPTHWIHINNLGDASNISLSTADKSVWDRLIIEMSSFSPPFPSKDNTNDILIKYVGEKYTFETYEPKNGINLSENSLYQIIVLKTK